MKAVAMLAAMILIGSVGFFSTVLGFGRVVGVGLDLSAALAIALGLSALAIAFVIDRSRARLKSL